MADRLPLVFNDGNFEQLQSGDTLVSTFSNPYIDSGDLSLNLADMVESDVSFSGADFLVRTVSGRRVQESTASVDDNGNATFTGRIIVSTGIGGSSNVVAGSAAGDSLTTGSNCVIIGDNAGTAITTQSGLFIGSGAGRYVVGGGNFALGTFAMFGDSGGGTTGSNNFAAGVSALGALRDGIDNVAIGNSAGILLEGGDNNMLIGRGAGQSLVSGSGCSLIGRTAGANATGSSIVGVGYLAARGANAGFSGNNVVCFGSFSGLELTTGSDIILIGSNAGRSLTTASNGVFIGDGSGFNGSQSVSATDSVALGRDTYTTGNNAVCIGAGVSAAANEVRIGNTSHTDIYFEGDLNVADGHDVVLDTTTGTAFATSTTQKLAFYGSTPVVQPASGNQAALSLLTITGTGNDADLNTNFSDLQTLVNQLRSELVTLGLIKGSA